MLRLYRWRFAAVIAACWRALRRGDTTAPGARLRADHAGASAPPGAVVDFRPAQEGGSIEATSAAQVRGNAVADVAGVAALLRPQAELANERRLENGPSSAVGRERLVVGDAGGCCWLSCGLILWPPMMQMCLAPIGLDRTITQKPAVLKPILAS